MVDLKHAEMRVIEDALIMGGGYVLRFSDKTFREFFEDEFKIEIYSEKYAFNGTSKGKHMRAFMKVEGGRTVAKALRSLWEVRMADDYYNEYPPIPLPKQAELKKRLFDLVGKLESGVDAPRIDAIERFSEDQTLDELVAAIERDIDANKPGPALDRLHTFCMKKFGHLLDSHGAVWERSEPLHSRVGKYVKALEGAYPLRDVSKQIIRSSISIFEKFNYVRNNDSLAHDNELPDHAEAHFIFDSVTTILRFVKRVEADRFGA